MSGLIARLNAALGGRYHIERQLGEGGMAKVYLADDLRHERKVALKVLKTELAAVVGADRYGRELYYLAPDGTLMAVDIGPGETLEAGAPEPLFRMSPDPSSLRFGSVYAPAPDGQRFLVVELDGPSEPQLVAMLNWSPDR